MYKKERSNEKNATATAQNRSPRSVLCFVLCFVALQCRNVEVIKKVTRTRARALEEYSECPPVFRRELPGSSLYILVYDGALLIAGIY